MDPRRAGAHGRYRRCRREPEVVVAVEVDGQPVDVLQRRADEVGNGLGGGDPQCVDDGHFLRARLDGGLVDLPVEVGLGARRVDAEEGRANAVLGCESHRARDALEHGLARDADRLELQVRDGRLDHRRLDSELDEELEVGPHRAREAPDLGGEAGARNQLDGPPVVLGHAREARLDPLDAEPVEQPRDLELVLGREDDADRLLAVAERRVVEADVAADRVAVVERSGPDQVLAHPSSSRSQKTKPSRSTTSPRRQSMGCARTGPAVTKVWNSPFSPQGSTPAGSSASNRSS